MTSATLTESVRAALGTVQDPDLHKDLVTLGMIKDLVVSDSGAVKVTVELTTPACPMKEKIKNDCDVAIRSVEGVTTVEINMTANVRAANPGAGRTPIQGVKNIIAVGSGKGGVGKSTTAVNLAIALSRLGAKVGLLDADIYGPNVPGMIGATGRPKVIENRIIPLQARGLSVMSMGFMVNDDQPLVWRGPMLHGVLKQLLNDVKWGELDYLVIDLPPGTGDVQLSLTQAVPLTGSVVVTTPQNVALQDAKKGIVMFQSTQVPILGIVENMSYYLCPKCGHRDEIFDSSGGENAAKKFGVPFLGRLPLNTQIREAMDRGTPVADDPGSEFGMIYREIAEKVAQQVSIANAKKPFAVIQA
jgi:ATP-binding protein involved in chromosome partitioning